MKHICPAPWDHHCVNTNGANRLCCNSVTSDKKFIHDFETYWKQDLARIRKEFTAGKRPAECESCWEKEDQGIKSLRQVFIENYKTRNEWQNFLDRLDSVSDYPVELDLKLGNYCNLSCRMCSSYSSSTYAKEFKQIYSDTKKDYGLNNEEKNYVQNKWYNSDKFVNLLEKIISSGVKRLKFTGGEPLMVPSVKTILEYCVKQNNAKDIEIVIITNGTLINQTWIDLFKKFKYTTLIVSIDGTEYVYDYIRHPSTWKEFTSKLELLKDCGLYKMLAFTLQTYNVLDIENIVNLSREYNFDLNLIPLNQPDYLDVKYLPTELKDRALEKIYKINPKTQKEIEFLNNIKNKLQNNVQNQYLIDKLLDISYLKDKYKKQTIKNLDIWSYYE